jgi:hypothetical protein
VRQSIDQLEAVAAIGAQCGEQAGRGALRGRGGIVELVRQIAGQLGPGRELLRLLLDAGDLAHAVEQRGDHALRHGGDGRQHLRKKRAVNQQRPDGRDGESLAAVAFMREKGSTPVICPVRPMNSAMGPPCWRRT